MHTVICPDCGTRVRIRTAFAAALDGDERSAPRLVDGWDRIKVALRSLSAEHPGLTYQELADVSGLTAKTCSGLMSHARRRGLVRVTYIGSPRRKARWRLAR